MINLNQIDLQFFSESNPAWMDQLPDNYKQDEGLAKFATIGDFAKDYKDNVGKLAGIEYAPENEADYEFDKTTLPDGLGDIAEGEAAIRGMAKQAGLTKAQAKKVYSWLQQTAVAEHGKSQEAAATAAETKKTEAKAVREKLVGTLKTDWGSDYPGKLELAKRGRDAFVGGDDEFNHVLEETILADGTKLGDDPRMIKAMVRYAEKIGEANLGPGAPGVPENENDKLNKTYPSMKGMPERNEG